MRIWMINENHTKSVDFFSVPELKDWCRTHRFALTASIARKWTLYRRTPDYWYDPYMSLYDFIVKHKLFAL